MSYFFEIIVTIQKTISRKLRFSKQTGYILLAGLFALTTIFNNQTVYAKEKEIGTLYAGYAVLMDASNRRVLFEKNGYEQVPMASTTKIMTLIVTLENANLDDVVNVSEYAASMPDVQLGICTGEKYRLSDLLYSLMLESHNDVAVAIAEHVGGSVEGFAKMMNEKAAELGANRTHFVTPNGLDADGHYTTAYDLALIASYAIENEEFLKIVQTPNYTFHEQESGKAYTVNNKDRFLNEYQGALGIKTGFTGKAGYCFVGAAEREGKKLVSVVLASGWPPNKNYKWQDTKSMMNYGMENYQIKKVLDKGKTFEQIKVCNSIEKSPVTPYVDEDLSILLSDQEEVSFELNVPNQLTAPVKAGETIGELSIKIGGEQYKILPVYAKETRREITFQYTLKRIFFKYIIDFFSLTC